MTSTLLLGMLVACLATTLTAVLRRTPTHARCPVCGEATVAVQPDSWLLRRVPRLVLRWCLACAWEGWGRMGAELVPGHPTARDSGFSWGTDRLGEGFGFRFRRTVSPTRRPPGFVWSTRRSEGAGPGRQLG